MKSAATKAWTKLFARVRKRAAYQLIAKHYQGRFARRSKLPYLNHIHDGVFLLFRRCGWMPDIIDAFCVHPIFQMDDSLKAVLADARPAVLARVPARVVVLAMEYRRVANAYTTRMKLRKPGQIELSPVAEVNRMLVADKIQNRKDFEQHVKGQMSRANARRHQLYFSGWLTRLGVSPTDYTASCRALSEAMSEETC